MPYKINKDLPDNVRKNLPQGAQTIYRKAFNNAFEQYKDPKKRWTGSSREITAHKVAWNAVKREYRKDQLTGKWVKI